MICPECNGEGGVRVPGLPDPWETSQSPFANEREIVCPTCKGKGVLSEAIEGDRNPPLCPGCSPGEYYNEIATEMEKQKAIDLLKRSSKTAEAKPKRGLT